MSTILEGAILERVPGAEAVRFEGDAVFVLVGETVTRYRLSREGQRIALLEREGRPLDIECRREIAGLMRDKMSAVEPTHLGRGGHGVGLADVADVFVRRRPVLDAMRRVASPTPLV